MEECCGEWNLHKYVRKQDREVLERALKGHLGAAFTPIAVSSQIVNGTNYIFICGAATTVPKAQTGLAKVYVYVPIGGEPQLKSIETII